MRWMLTLLGDVALAIALIAISALGAVAVVFLLSLLVL